MKFIALFLLLPLMGLSRPLPKEVYVAAKNGLSLRSNQSTNSNIITKIAYGEKVTVIGYDSSINIEGFSCQWAKIRYKDKQGHVAAIYLFDYPLPTVGTETVEQYFQQLSSLAVPVIKVGGNGAEDEEEGRCYIEKRFFNNGFEHHYMLGYEYSSHMYIVPNVSMQALFQVFRGLKEFKNYISTSTAFPNASKKISDSSKISVSHKIDDKGKPIPNLIEKISFLIETAEIGIGELSFFEKEGQIFVVIGEGV